MSAFLLYEASVDPNACRYEVSNSTLTARKMDLDDVYGPRRHAINPPVIRTRRQFLTLRREMALKGSSAELTREGRQAARSSLRRLTLPITGGTGT